ncbi:hypothetical protein [Streptomyces sp. NPDC093589]|uniref:hypothetical protein n=1 Tax=Streptomyces sp. NPDC093589 TaxID=3366043 RepID=UPI0037FDD710
MISPRQQVAHVLALLAIVSALAVGVATKEGPGVRSGWRQWVFQGLVMLAASPVGIALWLVNR